MKMLQTLLNPISQLAFDLRSSDTLKEYNAMQVLNKIFDIEINWKSLPHSQILNVIANLLGYYPSDNNSSWTTYRQRIINVSKSIDNAYQILSPISFNWIEHEDMASMRWYSYLSRNDVVFKNRRELLKKYLEISHIKFNRCKINNISFIGLSFGSFNTVEKEANADDLWDVIRSSQEKSFFKSSMGWLYLFDSKFIYCNFLNSCFRNAIFHNVDHRNSVFSSKEMHGDIMGADFSFCNNQYTVFSYCYAREAKFYKTKLDHATFAHSNLIGALFIKSSLKNACFIGAKIHNVSFKESNLQGADFTGSRVSNVDCRGADLRKVKGLDMSLLHVDETTLM